jgi:hypothetical protein
MNIARILLIGSFLFAMPIAFSGCGKEENTVVKGDVSEEVQANRDARMEAAKGGFTPEVTPQN